MLKNITISIILVLVLITVGCQTSSSTQNLQAIVALAAGVTPLIASASGAPPEVIVQIETYLITVNTAVSQATPILASTTLTQAQKAAQITALFAAIAVPNLPPGTPQNIAVAVTGVANAVAVFLMEFQPQPVAPASPKLVMKGATKVSATDIKVLAKIQEKAEYNLAILKHLSR